MNKINIEVLGAFARVKNNSLSQRREVRKGVWGKDKLNVEVLCGHSASAREKSK